MIRYRKGPCPATLKAIAKTPGSGWEGWGKQEVREAIVADQRGLCAYCQRRIAPTTAMKIDHWIAQQDPEHGAEHVLEWGNLIGACAGVTGEVRHCDTRRGDFKPTEQRLHLHPVEERGPDPRQHLRYRPNGTAYSDPADPRVDRDLTVLNLNAEFLKRNRENAVKALEHVLKKRGFTPRHVQNLLADLDRAAQAEEYVEVARDYLVRKLRRLE